MNLQKAPERPIRKKHMRMTKRYLHVLYHKVSLLGECLVEMSDPYITKCGHTFEKKHILGWYYFIIKIGLRSRRHVLYVQRL